MVAGCANPPPSGPVPAEAATIPKSDQVSFTTEQAIAFAIANNPQLRAARRQIAVAQAKLKWSGKLDDPEFELGANTDQWGLNNNESVVEVAFSQKFPLTDRLQRARDLSEVDLALAKAEVRIAEWNLAGEVRLTAVDALALERQVRLHRALRGVLAELAEQIGNSFQVAEASQIDLTEATLEVEAQTRVVRQHEAELAVINGRLRGLLGRTPDSHVRIAGELADPIPFRISPSAEVLARRPDLQLSLMQQSRAEAAIELARSRRWQDVAVRLFLERETAEDAPEGLERNTFAGVGFSLPLPLRTPEARLTDAPRQELAAAQASTEATSAEIRNEIATTNEELERRRLTWTQASGQTLELARRNIREVREAWRLGKENFLRLQRAQERSLALEENAIEALRDYHLALAKLHKAAALEPF
tara:strand:+ start:1537 stop:2793 length:1257 start_codon:yes stop_codon:yes gene_type:complete